MKPTLISLQNTSITKTLPRINPYVPAVSTTLTAYHYRHNRNNPMNQAISTLDQWGKDFVIDTPHEIDVSIAWGTEEAYHTSFQLCHNGLNPQGETLRDFIKNNLMEYAGIIYTGRVIETQKEMQIILDLDLPMVRRAKDILKYMYI